MAGRPHRWRMSWPGNFCLDCGVDDPAEAALAEDDAFDDCKECVPPEDLTLDSGCKTCCGTGVVPSTAAMERIRKFPPCPGPPGAQ